VPPCRFWPTPHLMNGPHRPSPAAPVQNLGPWVEDLAIPSSGLPRLRRHDRLMSYLSGNRIPTAPPRAEPASVYTRILDAPRNVVWQAWTEPERFEHWWGPRGYTTPIAETEPRVGGRIFWGMRPPSGPSSISQAPSARLSRPNGSSSPSPSQTPTVPWSRPRTTESPETGRLRRSYRSSSRSATAGPR